MIVYWILLIIADKVGMSSNQIWNCILPLMTVIATMIIAEVIRYIRKRLVKEG